MKTSARNRHTSDLLIMVQEKTYDNTPKQKQKLREHPTNELKFKAAKKLIFTTVTEHTYTHTHARTQNMRTKNNFTNIIYLHKGHEPT